MTNHNQATYRQIVKHTRYEMMTQTYHGFQIPSVLPILPVIEEHLGIGNAIESIGLRLNILHDFTKEYIRD